MGFAGPDVAHYLALASCVLVTAPAQLLLKTGAGVHTCSTRALFNRYTLAGYSLFGFGTLLAVYAMQAVDMKVVSTWSSLSYVLVVLLAAPLLGERLSRRKLMGCVLLVAGVVVFHLA